MGQTDSTAELKRLTDESSREIDEIKANGGTVRFVFDYHRYINDLRAGGENQKAVAIAGKRFRSRPVQMSAVAAIVKDMAALKAGKDDMRNFDPSLIEKLEIAAREAYIGAAGHFEKDSLNSLPEPGSESLERKQKAAADWDRLIRTDPDSLIFLAVFGHEREKGTSIPLSEKLKILSANFIIFMFSWTVSTVAFLYLRYRGSSITTLDEFFPISMEAAKSIGIGLLASLVVSPIYTFLFMNMALKMNNAWPEYDEIRKYVIYTVVAIFAATAGYLAWLSCKYIIYVI